MQGIILLGMPGAGKGTIGEYLHSHHGFTHISSGDLLRDEVKNQTEIGQQIDAIIKVGGRVDDALITQMVIRHLEQFVQNNESFVLDGYPQTLQQFTSLRHFETSNSSLHLRYIYVIVDKNIALERMSTRLSCQKCHAIYNRMFLTDQTNPQCESCQVPLTFRESDHSEKAKNRIAAFFETTEPLIRDNLVAVHEVDGSQSIDLIQIRINDLLKQISEK